MGAEFAKSSSLTSAGATDAEVELELVLKLGLLNLDLSLAFARRACKAPEVELDSIGLLVVLLRPGRLIPFMWVPVNEAPSGWTWLALVVWPPARSPWPLKPSEGRLGRPDGF